MRMIRYLKHEQIDKKRWDTCITTSAEDKVYALSWFLDVVSPGWQAIVEEENGMYITAMPLPGFHKMGFPYLGQPFHTHQLGIYTTAQSSADIRVQFLELTVKHYKFINGYRFNLSDTEALQALEGAYELTTRYTRYLDLNKPYPDLYRAYTRDRKMNLKRAQRAGLSMFESDDIEPLIQHFKTHIEHKVVGGVSEHTYHATGPISSDETEGCGTTYLYYCRRQGECWLSVFQV
ncbi:hypothetical protein GCM10028895_36610 [Pontibacter rugosus]